MLSFFKNLSLRTKIIGFNLVATIMIGSVVAYLFYNSTRSSMEKYNIVYQSFAASLQSAVGAQFYERYGDVQAFAINPDIKSNDKQTIVSTLNNYVALYGIYDLILVVDAKGNLIAANNKDYSGKDLNSKTLYEKNYSQEKWFQETLKGSFLTDTSKGYNGTYFEQPIIDPMVSMVYGEKRWNTGFSAQIKNAAGEIIGVISNRANFKWVENEILNISKNATTSLNISLEMMVLNKEGYVIGRYDAETDKGQYNRNFDELGSQNIYKEHKELSDLKYTDTGILEVYDSAEKTEQIAAFTGITDSKWITDIAWSVMIHVNKEQAYAHLYAAQREFFINFAIIASVIGVFGFLFGNFVSKQISMLSNTLSEETRSLLENSTSMATTSDQLSSAATEQAAALQETVSAIDEVSAMVTKNAENARRSKEISQSSEKSALQGKRTMEDMLHVIDEIHKSNTEMMEQIKKSNDEFTNIVNVISEIGSKTKVINDIVFQTKLLSFNASVEAARAGTHGKGFAVVAEEVGNLAQMSGNASKEISVLLDNSIIKVQSIVNETRARVDKLVDISKQKVDAGIGTAKLCSGVLDEIVTSVSQVNQMVEEIATASNEQAQGVSEITKAMNQLDQVTQQNTQAASVSSDTALSIKNKSEVFRSVVDGITKIVFGENGHMKHSETPQHSESVISLSKFKNKITGDKKNLEFKKVSGDSIMPDKNDPRFEDV